MPKVCGDPRTLSAIDTSSVPAETRFVRSRSPTGSRPNRLGQRANDQNRQLLAVRGADNRL